MTMDVSLRLRLENQLSREAQKAEKDLKDLGKAARKMGGNSSDRFERDLADVGNKARRAKADVDRLNDQARKLNTIRTDRSREQIRKLGDAANRMDGPAGRLHGPLKRLGGVAASAFAGLFAFASLDGAIRALSRFKQEAFEIEETIARLGVTLERYDPEFRQQVQDSNAKLSIRYGVKQGEINQARDVLARGGMDAKTSEGVIEPVIATSKSTGTSPEVWAGAAMALINQLNVSIEELPQAFDMMVKGDKLGAFSAEDMARNFPSIAAATKSSGREGLDAVAEMVAQAQIIVRGFGTPSEAATAQREILNKLFSPEVIKNFAESGMDMQKLNKQATDENRPLVDVVIEKIEKKGLGDKFGLGDLVRDTNARAALEQMKMNIQLYKEWLAEIAGASGVVDSDWKELKQLPIERQRRREAARNEIWRKSGSAFGGIIEPFSDFFSRLFSDEYDKIRTDEEKDETVLKYEDRLKAATAEKADLEARLKSDPTSVPGGAFQIADLKAEISRLTAWLEKLRPEAAASDSRQQLNELGVDPNRRKGGIPIPVPRPDPLMEKTKSGLSGSFGPEAEKSMQDYKKKISIEGDEAAGIARQKAQAIKAAFSFTATPTIAPRLVEPSRGGGRSGGTTVAVHQTISGAGNPERVAAAANRRQDRAIRQARAGALYDTGAYA
ncbi:MAG: phage tail tape measure protein [Hoeflea sp.]|uniref:phage tail tape measure protein n=1 Tax=Hoeflea sp. TaxID=1940281 RepID=UPI000C0FD04C|nr:phage tail tape measure protein [Hoeflea sp.]PHR24370.1 MAG: phage tail tape measure protein [Hoeflea sp.]